MTTAADLLPGVPLIESPLFAQALPDMGLSPAEQDIARELNEKGFALIDFPDPEICERIDRIRQRLEPQFGIDFSDPAAIAAAGGPRIQDAWLGDEDVKAIAANAAILDLLSRLYGRRAFPFQTLNFPVGTQQHAHSDSVHFSSQPERFMCGVWVAFEDIHPDAGPLLYYPGSHKWPIVTNAMCGRLGWRTNSNNAQAYAESVWRAMIEATGTPRQTMTARKGQALIWAANLLHGGSERNDMQRTRWSQVTHYYFDDCIYYTPAFSDEALGRLDIRTITDIATGETVPNRYLGEDVAPPPPAPKRRKSFLQRVFGSKTQDTAGLPADFDGEAYCRLNPDVAAAGEDPARHYLAHGMAEGRRYRD